MLPWKRPEPHPALRAEAESRVSALRTARAKGAADIDAIWRADRPYKRTMIAAWGLTKCAWCEQYRDWRRELDVEHFRPAGGVTRWEGAPNLVTDTPPREIPDGDGYWWLAYEWSNWTLACKTCNSGWKRNLFPVDGPRSASEHGWTAERPLLLDPASDFRPRDHFHWTDDGILEPESEAGRATILTCGLNRRELTVRRAKVARETIDACERFRKGLRADRFEPAELLGRGAYSEEFAGMNRTIVECRLRVDWERLRH